MTWRSYCTLIILAGPKGITWQMQIYFSQGAWSGTAERPGVPSRRFPPSSHSPFPVLPYEVPRPHGQPMLAIPCLSLAHCPVSSSLGWPLPGGQFVQPVASGSVMPEAGMELGWRWQRQGQGSKASPEATSLHAALGERGTRSEPGVSGTTLSATLRFCTTWGWSLVFPGPKKEFPQSYW